METIDQKMQEISNREYRQFLINMLEKVHGLNSENGWIDYDNRNLRSLLKLQEF